MSVCVYIYYIYIYVRSVCAFADMCTGVCACMYDMYACMYTGMSECVKMYEFVHNAVVALLCLCSCLSLR